MGINLLEFVKNQFSPALMSKIAGLVGEKSADTQKAIDVLLPSVLGGLANKATTLTGADNLLDMINEGGHDGRIFDTLSTLLGGGIATQGVLRIGNDVVNTLFDNKLGGIVNWVATHSGIKTGSTSSLMNLAAPLLMGAIGKQLDGKGNASSVIALLGSQLPYLKNAIPNDLLGHLGLSNLALGVPAPKEEPRPVVVPPVAPPPVVTSSNPLNKLFNKSPTKPAPPVVSEKAKEKPVLPPKTPSKPVATEKPQPKPPVPDKQPSKPIVIERPQNKPTTDEKPVAKPVADKTEKPLIQQLRPWLILLGAALFGLICLRMCKSSSADAPTTTPVVETTKTDTAQTVTATGEKTLKLTDGEIKVKVGSFLDLLYTTITDAQGDTSKSLVFNNVNFEKNKTDLTDSSKTQLNDLVKIMKAYPKLEIKINGYTDSRGDADENKKLSSGRAASVKSYLSARDINSDRMKTEGFGAVNPIASNETEEGRIKNRRIEVHITKK